MEAEGPINWTGGADGVILRRRVKRGAQSEIFLGGGVVSAVISGGSGSAMWYVLPSSVHRAGSRPSRLKMQNGGVSKVCIFKYCRPLMQGLISEGG